MRCAIIPPHILEHIVVHGDDPELRSIARRSLVADSALRTDRGFWARAMAIPPSPTGQPAKPNRTIDDAKHQLDLPGQTVRTEGSAPTGDPAADQSYDWLGATFDLFAQEYGRNSIDGAGMSMISTVHYGQSYDNAFWNGSQMVYGDGDGRIFTAFTGPIEVTGHELTHGVTQHTAALEYYGQSGALNESISDVFGSLVKQRHLGQTCDQADWLIGAGLLAPGVRGVALRSMKAPGTAYDDPQLGKDPQPADMGHYVETYQDNGGVHVNSGIPNRAFYLTAAAIGGHAWERAGHIWYETLTSGQLSPTADFAAFATATMAAAERLYGASGGEYGAVRDAWSEVGVKA
jgi:Zn-dependent metalloprotease